MPKKIDETISQILKNVTHIQEAISQRSVNRRIFDDSVWNELHNVVERLLQALKTGDIALARDKEADCVEIDAVDRLADAATNLASIDLKEPANIRLVLELAPETHAGIAWNLLSKEDKDKWRRIVK